MILHFQGVLDKATSDDEHCKSRTVEGVVAACAGASFTLRFLRHKIDKGTEESGLMLCVF